VRGTILFSFTSGSPEAPSIPGTLAPYMSASRSPTLAPALLRAIAKFTATVDLPTPPFPLATAITFFTREDPKVLPPMEEVTSEETSTFTASTPGRALTLAVASSTSLSLMGQAGVVRTSFTSTLPSRTTMSFTNPRLTISLPRSGSLTTERARNTCSLETDIRTTPSRRIRALVVAT